MSVYPVWGIVLAHLTYSIFYLPTLVIFYLLVPPEYKLYNFRELGLFWTLSPGLWASPVAPTVTYPRAVQETWVPALGREDPQRREWQPIPVFLPADFHGQRSLAGHRPWGCNESDTTQHACPGPYGSKHHSERSVNIYSMSGFTLLRTLSFPSAAILDGSAAPAIMRPESKQSFLPCPSFSQPHPISHQILLLLLHDAHLSTSL